MNKKVLAIILTMACDGVVSQVFAIQQQEAASMPASVQAAYNDDVKTEAQLRADVKAGRQPKSSDSFLGELWGSVLKESSSGTLPVDPAAFLFMAALATGATVLYGGYYIADSLIAPALLKAYSGVKGKPTHFCECKSKEQSVGGINCNRWCLKSGWSGKIEKTKSGIACICKNGSKEEQSCSSKFPPRCWRSGWTGRVFDAQKKIVQ